MCFVRFVLWVRVDGWVGGCGCVGVCVCVCVCSRNVGKPYIATLSTIQDVTSLTKKGNSPLDVARMFYHTEVEVVLTTHIDSKLRTEV